MQVVFPPHIPRLKKVFDWIGEHGGGTIIPLSVEHEQRLWDSKDDPAALAAIKEEGPNTDSALDKIIKTGYAELNLIYFFTCGEDEVRAWTVGEVGSEFVRVVKASVRDRINRSRPRYFPVSSATRDEDVPSIPSR